MKNADIDIKYKRLSSLKPVLNEWIKIHESFCKTSKDDSLYWYNERATLSTLAGAVWNLKGYCLEEYRTDKKYRKETYLGRADLWFEWRKQEYYIEAKQRWISLSKNAKSASRHINETIINVKKEAANTIKDSKGKSLGIVFTIPYLSLNESGNINNSISLFLEELEKVEYEIMAYTFPIHCRSLKSENYIYPGVALVGITTR